MWRVMMSVSLLCLAVMSAGAQSAEEMESIMDFIGTEDPEDVDAHEVERLCFYLEHQLRINSASSAMLRSSGLLTPYQAASLTDYRTRHGDIVSYRELESIDGFNADAVARLLPFISLAGAYVIDTDDRTGKVFNDLAVRGGVKVSDARLSGLYGMKYRLGAGERMSLALSASKSASAASLVPDTYSGHVRYDFRRLPLKIVLGGFNARFGQGLALWSGMSMSGLSKVASFYKSPSGISESWSFTGSSALNGVAAEIMLSRFRVSSFASFPAMCGINAGWYGRNMNVSMTHYADFSAKDMKTSLDAATCIDGTDVFAELSYDWVNSAAAVLAGLTAPACDDVRMALHLRCYPASYNPIRSAAPRTGTKCSNEYGISSACSWYAGNWIQLKNKDGSGSGVRRFVTEFSIDAAFFPVPKEDDEKSFQCKVLADSEMMLTEALKFKIRLSERYRTWDRNFKTDFRADLSWQPSSLSLNSRLHLTQCVHVGALTYVEGGYNNSSIAVYLRQGIFLIDDWEDRVYAYERDAPGSFSVPAFYGRGVWTSLTASWMFMRGGKLYFRCSMTSFPFMQGQKKKPGKAELKLQCTISF